MAKQGIALIEHEQYTKTYIYNKLHVYVIVVNGYNYKT